MVFVVGFLKSFLNILNMSNWYNTETSYKNLTFMSSITCSSLILRDQGHHVAKFLKNHTVNFAT